MPIFGHIIILSPAVAGVMEGLAVSLTMEYPFMEESLEVGALSLRRL